MAIPDEQALERLDCIRDGSWATDPPTAAAVPERPTGLYIRRGSEIVCLEHLPWHAAGRAEYAELTAQDVDVRDFFGMSTSCWVCARRST